MDGHPGGLAHTERMLALSGLVPPAQILDMGAGDGEALLHLRKLGFPTAGIDKVPRSSEVTAGDFLAPPWPNASFDGVLSQCAFYASSDVPGAFAAAFRVLKPGGILMLSDVCPRGTSLADFAADAGFTVCLCEDLTPLWKEYYIEAIWRGTADGFPCGKRMDYQLLIGKKEGETWI